MKDSNNYTVYMHESPSGKRYIGITARKPEKRWGGGCNYKDNSYFWKAIQKYGWENIKHIILAENLNKEEACEKEKEYIAAYKTDNALYGYNRTKGGEHYEFTDEVREQMHKPKNLTEEMREKMRERGRACYEKNLAHRKPTPEQIRKMSEAKRGKKQPEELVRQRAESLKKRIAEKGGFSEEHRAKLSQALKGRTHSEETLKKMKAAHAPDKNARSRAVRQKQGDTVIAEYCSVREAGRQTGIDYTSIVRAIAGTRIQHAGGYSWEYV